MKGDSVLVTHRFAVLGLGRFFHMPETLKIIFTKMANFLALQIVSSALRRREASTVRYYHVDDVPLSLKNPEY